MNNQEILQAGDYVLATKYSDGDPKDSWVVGIFDHTSGGRHYVTDGDGNQFRRNGFRRVKKISENRGAFLMLNRENIKMFTKSLWWWARVGVERYPNIISAE